MLSLAEVLPDAKDFASFGAAGLMGLLWIWERRLSRGREAQLTEAHRRLMHERGVLRLLASLVRRNTAALARLEATQQQLLQVLTSFTPAESPDTDAPTKGAA